MGEPPGGDAATGLQRTEMRPHFKLARPLGAGSRPPVRRCFDADVGVDGDDRDEDRELSELLSELRVVLPGVTVLFAFLLTVPFTARFGSLTGPQRGAYFVAFLTTATSIVFLVGEVAYHRLRGKPYDKVKMITTVTRQTVAAVALLGVALVAVVFLVSDVLYAGSVAIPLAAAIALLSLVAWFGIPLARRRRSLRQDRPTTR